MLKSVIQNQSLGDQSVTGPVLTLEVERKELYFYTLSVYV